MALSSRPTPTAKDPNVALGDAFNHFYRTVAKMLYFNVSQVAVREYGDGFQVSCIVSDEDGEDKNIYINLSDGDVECVRFDGLILGVDQRGMPVKGNPQELNSMFSSSFRLLLQGITEWSQATGVDVDCIAGHFEMFRKVAFDRIDVRNGKNFVLFA